MTMNPGQKKILALLNEVLTGELTAINQYFLHAKMCDNWGFARLGKIMYRESIDEMHHAEWLVDRILLIGGVPNLQRLGKLNIGETVPEQLESDLAIENNAIPLLNGGIELCREHGDNATRALLEKILTSEEEHRDWIESQQELIAQVGVQNYLTQQIRPDAAE
ncbi:MAG: bacterioferritin [Myxococcota bacterium]|jgi:bacterioferritin